MPLSPPLQRIRRLAWLLDNSIPIPGTRYRFGLDPLIGLVPGLGDIVGMALSAWIVIEAAGLGVSHATLLRMAWNVVVESVLGAIPILGDLFDAVWKANARNVILLEQAVNAPVRQRHRDRWFVALLGGGFLLTLGGITWGMIALFQWIAGLL